MEPNWLKSPMPFELGMALVENPAALHRYAALDRDAKQRFVDAAAEMQGRTQMQGYVQSLCDASEP